ncbi:MAG: BlaI/MecI/CopY family transcriptional regulator [Actinobacteria bacterium]|nr:BlaI/MecI/CopY family transcriptional regulator [Actinomycetota bacterium]
MKRGAKKCKATINGLSQIEADVMQIIWKRGKTTVRGVHEEMLANGYIPYTTVMATMTNLSQKGILKQNKSDRAYLYSAVISNTKIANEIVDNVIEKVLGGSPKPIISHLLRLKNEAEVDELIELRNKLNP